MLGFGIFEMIALIESFWMQKFERFKSKITKIQQNSNKSKT
jgi:hypothetical protein